MTEMAGTNMNNKATILVVDDNEDFRLILKLILGEFNVIEAENGEIAVDLYLKNRPDLVLMDILMPVMDGITATEKIMKKDPNAKVIAITAYSSRASEILNVGAKEVLSKPFKKNSLISTINKYLELNS